MPMKIKPNHDIDRPRKRLLLAGIAHLHTRLLSAAIDRWQLCGRSGLYSRRPTSDV